MGIINVFLFSYFNERVYSLSYNYNNFGNICIIQ
jgi:hypothetical protein